jgi:hypothetical protein
VTPLWISVTDEMKMKKPLRYGLDQHHTPSSHILGGLGDWTWLVWDAFFRVPSVYWCRHTYLCLPYFIHCEWYIHRAFEHVGMTRVKKCSLWLPILQWFLLGPPCLVATKRMFVCNDKIGSKQLKIPLNDLHFHIEYLWISHPSWDFWVFLDHQRWLSSHKSVTGSLLWDGAL